MAGGKEGAGKTCRSHPQRLAQTRCAHLQKVLVKRAVLFGSAAEGGTGKIGDIDLLVMPLAQSITGNSGMNWERHWQIRGSLHPGQESSVCPENSHPRGSHL